MPLTGISEFTFGFAFLHEQTNRHIAGLTAVPILPSLQQEAGWGWDARLPINGLLNHYQFKLSDYLVRGNAKYIAVGTYAGPYYRFSLHRRNSNQQHNRLRELSVNYPETFYVAPELDDLDVFNHSFINAQIVANSRIIRVEHCQDIHDGDQHYITYQPGNPAWIEHSEPKRHENSYFGKDLDELLVSQKDRMVKIDRDFAASVWQKQSEITRTVFDKERKRLTPNVERLLSEPRENTKAGFLKAAADLSLTFFGAAMVVVGETEPETFQQ